MMKKGIKLTLIGLMILGGCAKKENDNQIIHEDIHDEVTQKDENQELDLDYLKNVDSVTIWYLTDYIVILDHKDVIEEIRQIPENCVMQEENYDYHHVYDIKLDEHTIHVYYVLSANYFKVDDNEKMYRLTGEISDLFERIRIYPSLLEVDEILAHESINVKDSNVNDVEDLIKMGVYDDVGYTSVVFGGLPAVTTGYDLDKGLYIIKYLDKQTLQYKYIYYDWNEDVVYQDNCEYDGETDSYVYPDECDERLRNALKEHRNNFLNDFFQMDREGFISQVDDYIQDR